jgi:hypothetical protein
VKILLDKSPKQIAEYRSRYGDIICQLRTPLTAYARAHGVPYGIDNGGYKELDILGWLRLVDQAEEDRPLFIAMPDIVGSAARTIELFEHFKLRTNGLPRALVLQDGLNGIRIPWNDIAAVFVGGSDQFKSSPEAFAAAKAARALNKHVHLGRCNTAARARNWIGVAHTCDGSGMSMYDHMLIDVIAAITGTHPQQALIA